MKSHFLSGPRRSPRTLSTLIQTDVGDLVRLVHHEVPLLVGAAQVAEDALDLDEVADDGDVYRLLGALVQHRQGDGGLGLALDQVDRLAHADVVGRLAVDLEDDVAGEDACLVGGGADHGADDGQKSAVLAVEADLDAGAAELALALLVELLVVARVDVRRVGVEALQPAVDHVLDQLALAVGGDVHDVLLPHLVEDVHHQAHQLVILVALARRSAVGDRQAEDAGGGDAEQPVQVLA
jgi:hypothetical protein